ncbi:uncharacterized protein BDZ99DRAFT_472561 [Mytilinidion resinicola]|uniref:Uncharacterized protein n=1 Tax=Mytilinidion resinicola TaxID=574789 RepID=A0A6A6Z255_9PEZI|nr:uncharacterized protein BDZ99DRAFT_472561 [Mytilinidion resinicola]KAF2815252.1 hypothetical protein BDZ99DRAFT_472561 [Mytilinidion resinicola]
MTSRYATFYFFFEQHSPRTPLVKVPWTLLCGLGNDHVASAFGQRLTLYGTAVQQGESSHKKHFTLALPGAELGLNKIQGSLQVTWKNKAEVKILDTELFPAADKVANVETSTLQQGPCHTQRPTITIPGLKVDIANIQGTIQIIWKDVASNKILATELSAVDSVADSGTPSVPQADSSSIQNSVIASDERSMPATATPKPAARTEPNQVTSRHEILELRSTRPIKVVPSLQDRLTALHSGYAASQLSIPDSSSIVIPSTIRTETGPSCALSRESASRINDQGLFFFACKGPGRHSWRYSRGFTYTDVENANIVVCHVENIVNAIPAANLCK